MTSLAISLGINSVAVLNRGSGGTPAPTPAPTKVVFEGDSITSATSPVSMANQWIAANPSVASANIAVASAKIRNGTSGNSMDERRTSGALATAIGSNTPILCILIGANDLHLTATYANVTDWQSSLLTYIAAVRASHPTVKVGVGTVLPVDETVGSRTGFNARRATVNAWMRGQVGTTIDFLIPYGDHPIMGLDAAATGPAFSDGVHPSSTGASYMASVLNAALDPIIAGASGSTPTAFTFSDFATATASTQYTATTVVTGMGMGQSANASVTNSGDVARGTGSYGTGPTAVMNGDILTSRVTSDADSGDTVQHTLTVGSRSDTWDITTAAATATTVWDQAYGVAQLKYPSAREVKGPLTGETNYNTATTARADKGYDVSVANKRYFEMTFTAGAAGSNGGPWAASVATNTKLNTGRPGQSAGAGNGAISYRSTGVVENNGVQTTSMPTFGAADAIGVAIDYALNKVWFSKNGTWINGGDPATNTGGWSLTVSTTTKWFAACSLTRNEGHILNCGQDPFTTAPPSGFIAYG